MPKHPSIIIGEYLRLERTKQGLSLDKLANHCQVSSSQISVIERGKNPITGKYNNITLTSLELIGQGLGLSVREILENSGYYDNNYDTINIDADSLYTLLHSKYKRLSTTQKRKVLLYIEEELEKQR